MTDGSQIKKGVIMILIILQFFTLSQQCNYAESYDENLIFIQSENVGISLFKNTSSWCLYAMQNESYAVYKFSTPLSSTFRLTFDDDFKINDNNLTVIDIKGKIVLANCKSGLSAVEPIELCLDFATERIILKVITPVLGLLLFVTNFKSTFSNFISRRKLDTHPSPLIITTTV